MAVFRYKAVDARGKSVFGRLEAGNDEDLEQRLGRMGLDLIHFRPIDNRRRRGRRISRTELITFCFHLEQMVRAGIPILEALQDLRDSIANLRFREVINAISDDIEGGQTLSQAMERFPGIFNSVFINLVRSGELSGTLPAVLKELTETLKWQDELASHAKKILIYPAIVTMVVIGVMVFMLAYLVPQLSSFLGSMGQSLPLHTQLLVALSDGFVRHWQLIVFMPPLLVVTLLYLRRTSPRVAYRLDAMLLALPYVGGILRKIILARFANNFALMYGAGVSVMDCLSINRTLTGNRVISEALERVRAQVEEGVGLSTAFGNAGLFPTLVVRMIRVGENSGALEEALRNISYFYSRNVRESIERVQRLIEPTLTAVLGVLLGWLMLSVLGPIYEIIGTMDF
ncbi:MAG TPA: type II secretion system F family protein [Gammaproteobacteria bacterium]|nr:type II secretion system F family protein [Gammaproteobacteria bacterium]